MTVDRSLYNILLTCASNVRALSHQTLHHPLQRSGVNGITSYKASLYMAKDAHTAHSCERR